MTHESKPVLGMILKGFPRISETFISNEIAGLESLGLFMEIYSMRQPRENFCHDHVRNIKAPLFYLPEYIGPNLKVLLKANVSLFLTRPLSYARHLFQTLIYTLERKRPLTPSLRHFLQAGYLSEKKLSGGNIRHIHAHFCHSPTSLALYASRLTGLPFSFTAHAKDIYTSDPLKLASKIRAAKFVITCTEYNRTHLRSLLPSLSTPIHTIYHGIDLKRFQYSHTPRAPLSPFKILSVGRFVRKKGYDDLMKALFILKKEGISFQCIHAGDGDLREEIHRLAFDLGIAEHITFLGSITQEDLRFYYNTSHCFVLACKIAPDGDRDGLPNAILEAMATGLPVVTTNVSAIPEAVEHGKTGLLVEPSSPKALAKAITRVFQNYHEAEERAFKARKVVEERFDTTFWTAKLYTIFHNVLYNDET